MRWMTHHRNTSLHEKSTYYNNYFFLYLYMTVIFIFLRASAILLVLLIVKLFNNLKLISQDWNDQSIPFDFTFVTCCLPQHKTNTFPKKFIQRVDDYIFRLESWNAWISFGKVTNKVKYRWIILLLTSHSALATLHFSVRFVCSTVSW